MLAWREWAKRHGYSRGVLLLKKDFPRLDWNTLAGEKSKEQFHLKAHNKSTLIASGNTCRAGVLPRLGPADFLFLLLDRVDAERAPAASAAREDAPLGRRQEGQELGSRPVVELLRSAARISFHTRPLR